MFKKNKEVIEGLFYEGEMVMKRKGKEKYPDGSYYEGGFWMEKKSGKGKLVMKNGC